MQNFIVNVLLITSLLRTSLMHNDYYFKAQFWASLVSHSLLWIFHQKLVATNPIQLLLSPSFPDHGFCNWRVYNNLMLQCSNLFFCYNVFFSWWKLHRMVRIPGLQCDLWQRDSGSLKKLHQSTPSTWGKELLCLWTPCGNKGVQLKRMSKYGC